MSPCTAQALGSNQRDVFCQNMEATKNSLRCVQRGLSHVYDVNGLRHLITKLEWIRAGDVCVWRLPVCVCPSTKVTDTVIHFCCMAGFYGCPAAASIIALCSRTCPLCRLISFPSIVWVYLIFWNEHRPYLVTVCVYCLDCHKYPEKIFVVGKLSVSFQTSSSVQ